MDITTIVTLTERLRHESIGNPVWVESKGVFEYPNQTVDVVVVLKIIRAAHGVSAMNLLSHNGLFIDMGAIYRCVFDSTNEVYFLLENYPNQSGKVRKFLNNFYATTIDGFISSKAEAVQAKDVHNAVVRYLTGREQDELIKRSMSNVYKTFSGYIHSNYSHVMEVYGGDSSSNPSFNILGVPSQAQKDKQKTFVFVAYVAVLHAIASASYKFGLTDLFRDTLAVIKAEGDT